MSIFTACVDFIARIGGWFSHAQRDDFPPDHLLTS